MASYEIRTVGTVNIDGQEIEADKTIAIIETPVDLYGLANGIETRKFNVIVHEEDSEPEDGQREPFSSETEITTIGLEDRVVSLLAASNVLTVGDAREFYLENGTFSVIKGIGDATNNVIAKLIAE